jgi:hypothetical protein
MGIRMYLYTVDTGMHDARFTEDGLSVLAGCSSALLHVCSAARMVAENVVTCTCKGACQDKCQGMVPFLKCEETCWMKC